MTSWYSNLLTKTSSQISSLKSTLLSSETDGDTEDDTHVCRVLRDFYAEKGRPLPPWLPPDPRAATTPGQTPPQAVYAQSQVPGQRFPGQHPQQQGPSSAAGFGSLWDNNSNHHNAATSPHDQGGFAGAHMGHNGGGVAGGGAAAGPGYAGKRPPQLQVQTQSLRAGGVRNGGMLSPIAPPAQRAGSYPNPANPGNQTPTFGGGSAQDRLRQRLWGGARTTSPSAQGGPFQPPPSPGAQGGGDGPAYMGANAPWSNSGPDDYFGNAVAGAGGGGGGGGGGAAGGGAASRRQGLANGPRGAR